MRPLPFVTVASMYAAVIGALTELGFLIAGGRPDIWAFICFPAVLLAAAVLCICLNRGLTSHWSGLAREESRLNHLEYMLCNREERIDQRERALIWWEGIVR